MTDMSVRHIICFGNPLHGDDGFGAAVFEALQSRVLPQGTRLIDGGTSSLSALNLFAGCERAIVVDAIHDDGRCGTLSWMGAEEVSSDISFQEMSSHGLGVGSILQGLKILKEEGEIVPEIDILTCSVETVRAFKMELSDTVQNAVLPAVGQILDKLKEARG